MRNSTPGIASFGRTLAMLEAVIADGGQSSISAIARSIGMPVATAHRQVATLMAEGYLATGGRGHVAGPRLLGLLHRIDEKQVLAAIAAPVLDRLSRRLGCVVQLGTFENDMVTYRVKAGKGAADLFTKIGMQLEAYCSGMGKVLLAHLPESQQEAYLAGGPFVALTPATITDPAVLAEEMARVREQAYAVDDGEVDEGLYCVAVPVHAPDGSVPAAISVSQAGSRASIRSAADLLPELQSAAREVELAASSSGQAG